MIRFLLMSLMFLLVGSIATHAADAPAGHVKATLLSDMKFVRGGKTFTVGVLLEIDPHWHIYWTNPGESGQPTTFTLKLPEGFIVTPDPFPIPRQFHQANNTIAYGYDTTVLLTARVTPPADLRIGSEVPIEAAVSWVCCNDVCIPGKENLNLTLKVSGHTDPLNVEVFNRGLTTVGIQPNSAPDLAGIEAKLDPQTHLVTMTVHWKTPVQGVQVFPGADDALSVSKVSVKSPEKEAAEISMKVEVLEGKTPMADRLPILIAYRDSEGHERGIQSSIPVK